MAGASLTAEVAPHARVLLLEMEDAPGYHATGRSAAFWVESYGGPQVQPLTAASGGWLNEAGFLHDRGGLNIARADQRGLLDAFEAEFSALGIRLERWDRAAMEQAVPGLRAEWVDAIYEPDSKDIDVGGLHAHFLARARTAGAQPRCRSRLTALERVASGWSLTLVDGTQYTASVLVNAAGAWADVVAGMAGVRPLGIQPYRRTMLQLRTEPQPRADMPVVLDIGGSFYFKPESGRLWLSPHDETPSAPCDAAPEEIDLAQAIDRLEQTVDWRIAQLEHKWAGLRSFAPDRLPIYGFDPRNRGFFWFAGQGGFGIQTAPAAARLAGQLLLNLSSDDMTRRLDPALYSPARFG
ncbi:putative oxidoreductase [Caenibius tardaugens NBRC 16725]|uniref:Putative oxidoreductase n=2 Tax=Caenibius TaxID=2827482 RepID=U2ZVP3_9SPHN|nr:FAD-dependent oxidoreductase [Caenibius tardaugens]GAD49434.1 putative oxidoreductase [Caenibius tardaugens NBRC 16725]